MNKLLKVLLLVVCLFFTQAHAETLSDCAKKMNMPTTVSKVKSTIPSYTVFVQYAPNAISSMNCFVRVLKLPNMVVIIATGMAVCFFMIGLGNKAAGSGSGGFMAHAVMGGVKLAVAIFVIFQVGDGAFRSNLYNGYRSVFNGVNSNMNKVISGKMVDVATNSALLIVNLGTLKLGGLAMGKLAGSGNATKAGVKGAENLASTGKNAGTKTLEKSVDDGIAKPNAGAIDEATAALSGKKVPSKIIDAVKPMLVKVSDSAYANIIKWVTAFTRFSMFFIMPLSIIYAGILWLNTVGLVILMLAFPFAAAFVAQDFNFQPLAKLLGEYIGLLIIAGILPVVFYLSLEIGYILPMKIYGDVMGDAFDGFINMDGALEGPSCMAADFGCYAQWMGNQVGIWGAKVLELLFIIIVAITGSIIFTAVGIWLAVRLLLGIPKIVSGLFGASVVGASNPGGIK